MLHNLRHQRPVPNYTLYLLRQRLLFVIVLLTPSRYNYVDARTQTREDFRPQALPSEVNRRPINLVEHNRWQGAQHLHLELWALNDVHSRDEGVDDKGYGGAVIERYSICFAVNTDGSFGAARDEDGLID